ncbi:MAG: NifB/NifX family molybdenum-iron cluster-binding protein [Candidatus Bipolaricaulaceae bacterium]
MSQLVVVATGRGGLEDQVSPVFGRAETFTVVEVDGGEVKRATVIPNPHKDAPSGAGIQAAQLVAAKSPRAALAGNFGPNVSGVLGQAGVEQVPAAGMAVRQAVESYLAGQLPTAAGPTPGPGAGFGAPGMGLGTGRGGGRGMGRGAGGGRRSGMGSGWGGAGWTGGPPAGMPGPEDVGALRERIARLESELETVQRRLSELKGGE